jgi:polysaccharide export outer membrane protein
VERVEKLRRSIGERSAVTITVAKTFPAACRELVRADVLVCPRGSWSGFPIKVLNYMALGRPIVHSRSSAHPIEHEVTGLLCDDGDPEGLADAILRLNRDPALAERLGSAAREAALARFGWAQVIPTVLECYRRATGGPPQQPPEEPRLKMVKGKRSARPLPRGQRHRIRGYAQGPTRKSMTRIVGLLFAVYVLASIAGCAGRQVASESVAPLPPLEAPEVPVSTDTSDSYRLRPGDVVRVKFLYHPELDVKLPIRPDGSVTLQGVGELHAAGKTANELAREIEKVSAKQLRDPEVTVIVADLGPHKVYVGGEVRVPGYVLFVEGMTPLQAILDRGGFTEFARTDSVLRLTIRDQSYQATRIDLSTNISHGGADLTTLAANDVLFVPRTFIGDANAFVRNYVRGLLPVVPRAGVGIGITP